MNGFLSLSGLGDGWGGSGVSELMGIDLSLSRLVLVWSGDV